MNRRASDGRGPRGRAVGAAVTAEVWRPGWKAIAKHPWMRQRRHIVRSGVGIACPADLEPAQTSVTDASRPWRPRSRCARRRAHRRRRGGDPGQCADAHTHPAVWSDQGSRPARHLDRAHEPMRGESERIRCTAGAQDGADERRVMRRQELHRSQAGLARGPQFPEVRRVPSLKSAPV